ncbi:hypothetical protein [Streptomyces sp. SDr-06]|uniref:hypothetical protein n=1 Tax=Streptomyces sp. SDr-06 TaxID=2267702 RepID=UPI003982E9A9
MRELSRRAFPEPDVVADDAPAPIEQARAQPRRQAVATEAAALRRARGRRLVVGRSRSAWGRRRDRLSEVSGFGPERCFTSTPGAAGRGRRPPVSKKKKAAIRRRQAKQRSFQVRYPHYVACRPEEILRELGAQRTSELEKIYRAPLQKADLELEKLLRAGRFTVVDSAHPEGRTWTMDEYLASWNEDLAQDARRNHEEPDFMDAAELMEILHHNHAVGALWLTGDLTFHRS